MTTKKTTADRAKKRATTTGPLQVNPNDPRAQRAALDAIATAGQSHDATSGSIIANTAVLRAHRDGLDLEPEIAVSLQRANDRWYAASKDKEVAERQRDKLLTVLQQLDEAYDESEGMPASGLTDKEIARRWRAARAAIAEATANPNTNA